MCIYTYIDITVYEYSYTRAYIYVYVTINNEEAINLNMSKEGCMGGFRERKWEEKYVIILQSQRKELKAHEQLF